MKFHIPPILLVLALLFGCSSPSQKEKKRPKIAIAGLAIESSTFSPAQTHAEAFHHKVGKEVFSYYPFLSVDSVARKRAEWHPALYGHALPGGIVTRGAYDSLVQTMLQYLEENAPYDGLFFDIHGAMSVVGLDDPEGDLIRQVRQVVGPKCLISTCMDLHGNVSERLAQQSDLITCFRMAPHEDALDSRQRAVENLLDRLENGMGKPKYKAWIPVPVLLPGEKTSTRIDPGKSLYARIDPITQKEGVTDAAIWVGYAWADEPRNHAVVMAYGDEEKAVKEGAESLARSFWEARKEFEFVAPTTTFEEAMSKALSSDKRPFIISDMGDNPTAGGAGDVTWTLQEILKYDAFYQKNGPELIYASIPGPKLVAEALKVGVGSQVDEVVGAAIDDRFAPPLRLQGKISAIKEGDLHAETEVVVEVGNVSVIVTKKRKPYHKVRDFTDLDLDPRTTDILVVKIGYLVPELYDIRADWVMALTPGGVDQDLERLGYKRIKRPMFPLDKEMKNPDLSARMIPLSSP